MSEVSGGAAISTGISQPVPLPFSPPLIPDEAIHSVERALRSGWIGTGPVTREFEREFSQYVGAPSAAAVSSCTSGLFLALKALGVGPGDEVVTTAMTFCSTINAILHAGAMPVLVDIDEGTGNLSIDQAEAAITPATRCILPVHYAGYPVNMDRLMALAHSRDLLVVEDCAHAIESEWSGRHAGTFGNAGAFSFYATKNLPIGEGGMVVSREPETADAVAQLALHGLSRGAWQRFSHSGKKTYDVLEVGYKANMTDIQSAIGLAQLAILESNYLRRQQIWDFYSQELSDCAVTLPQLPSVQGARHALHLFVVLLEPDIDRDMLVQRISDEKRVAMGVHYRAISDFSLYQRELGVRPDALPVATKWGRTCMSLSLSPAMTDLDVERVVNVLRWAL